MSELPLILQWPTELDLPPEPDWSAIVGVLLLAAVFVAGVLTGVAWSHG